MSDSRRRIEFGDFQTPPALAASICARLAEIGIQPDMVIEPTCGVGAFLAASASSFPEAKALFGFEINAAYLDECRRKLPDLPGHERIRLEQADFFATDWRAKFSALPGSMLVIGNFPWVTSATQGAIGGGNLPEKSNFQARSGFDAITGKANFDISEWMLLEVLRWFAGRQGDLAMLVKSSVARKVLAQAERLGLAVREACMIGIDAKKAFAASVEACLLVIRFGEDAATACYDYSVFTSMNDHIGRRVGHRLGLTVGDLEAFEAHAHLVGTSPQKWRSGVKHDAAGIMEFTLAERGLENGLGELVSLENEFLYPLLKGSDVGSGKPWRGKYVLMTQRRVGDSTDGIARVAPLTWDYLNRHAAQLDGRGSSIYVRNPRFSIFGVGDYAFQPWKIAICGLYKTLKFRLVGPIDGRPAMFDDTVYYLSFATEAEAAATLAAIESEPARALLRSLIFWDEKRPVKTSILNALDWSRLDRSTARQPALI